jgi:hypothetical protein
VPICRFGFAKREERKRGRFDFQLLIVLLRERDKRGGRSSLVCGERREIFSLACWFAEREREQRGKMLIP